ncbi:hypothetical protein AB0A60_19210 [Streptomyces sp. NPDC046275]|uniref:hypothetical protein n=1 Tax=Streptomyces sp. NPDC046275 TaxID=3157201 RepID=UPI0033C7D6A5
MTKRRNFTRELITKRDAAYQAHRYHHGDEHDRPPMLRVMAGFGPGLPVAYEPRSKSDPLPWVEYNGDTGIGNWRYNGRECWTAPVEKHNEIIARQTISRSVYLRLAAAGIACEGWGDSAGTHARYTFADNSEVTWSGTDVYGAEVSNHHPIGEHGSLGAHWMQHEQPPYLEELPEFATGNYATDSAALVAWMIGLADRHGRRHQEHATQEDTAAALAWQQATGGFIATTADCARYRFYPVDGSATPAVSPGENWLAAYELPTHLTQPTHRLSEQQAREVATSVFFQQLTGRTH